MGVTKSEIFTTEQNDLAQFAKAFAHPARIAILQHLAKTNACYCGDLAAAIGLAQPTISQHLRALKEVDIIQGNVEGTSVCYCLNQEKWTSILSNLSNFFTTIQQNVKRCC